MTAPVPPPTPRPQLLPGTTLTGDVGGNLSEGGLAKAFGGAGAHRDQVGGARVQVGEHVVGLVAQLGHGPARAWNVDPGVR